MTGFLANRHVLTLTAFLIPVLLVKGVAVVLDAGGPRTAAATRDATTPTPAISSVPLPAARTKHTDQPNAPTELELYLTALREQSFGSTPLYYEPRAKPSEPVIVVEPTPKVPTLRVEVRAIMSARNGTIALIDGQPYAVGDRLSNDEWTIAAIYADERLVEFRHVESGEIVVGHVIGPR